MRGIAVRIPVLVRWMRQPSTRIQHVDKIEKGRAKGKGFDSDMSVEAYKTHPSLGTRLTTSPVQIVLYPIADFLPKT